MTKLSDSQRVILSQASQRDDRLAIPPERLPAAARQTVAKSLIKQGLVSDEHASATSAQDAWQIDGQARLLRITDAGLRAIGVEVEHGGTVPADAATVRDTAPTGADNATARNTTAAPAEPAQGAPLAADTGDEAADDDRPRHERLGIPDDLIYGPANEDNGDLHPAAPRITLGSAARQVLDAWDDTENQRRGLPAAIAALRVVLATKPARPPRETGARRQPRSGTKQETVLALLRRDGGTTIADIIAATGWQQHTVRGFLAGLKRKGMTVEVLERVRQVGPDKQGAKGSYSIYRIAPATAPAKAG